MDLRSYEPGQITDQFVPLYRTLGKGLGGAAADGAGSAPGSETDGELDDPTRGATHYPTRAVNPPWARDRAASAEIGRHLFYNDVE